MSSVRSRVFAALAATALVCTVLTVGVASLLLERQAHERRLATIGRLADAIAPSLAAGSGTTRVVRVSSLVGGRTRPVRGAARARLLGAIGPGAGDGEGFADTGRRRVAYALRTTAAGRVALVGPSGERAVTGPPPARTVLLAGAGGLVVALVLSALLTRRLTEPVRTVSDAARRVAEGDHDVRVPERGALEFQRLGRSFNAMTSDLREAREAQRRFVASVSHELKTPLTAVRGYAEAIVDGAVEPVTAGLVIRTEAERLERLVGDLIDLARLSRPGLVVAREPIDLAAIAAAAVERHALDARELGVGLRVDGPPGAEGIGDEGRTLQAVSNLVENALRVAPPGSCVEVAARRGRIEVRDAGPGLDAAEAARAFERFYLHDRRAGDRSVGSGLGLALVAELAAGMAGHAAVSSTPGGPTTFTLVLDGSGRQHPVARA